MKHQRNLKTLGMALICIQVLASTQAFAQRGRRYERSVATYDIPDVTLLNQDRTPVQLKEVIASSNKPVMLDFIFGTCTTICPILSASFSNFQRKLGAGAGDVSLISISIDPEHDTPEVMKKYLEKYRAQPGWDFLTGNRSDTDDVMRAFDAFVPDKMSHRPLTFLKSPASDEWIRIDGLISTRALIEEYQKLLGE